MIDKVPLPPSALLARYAADEGDFPGAYVDCYVTEVDRDVSLAEFVVAFYTTALFRLERVILGTVARSPSTDAQARELAAGERDAFAAWTVEARSADQLLMCDSAGRTRSWFQVEGGAAKAPSTLLRFGSAVVARPNAQTGEPELGALFHALLGFHKQYSRGLLWCAARALRRAQTVC